MAAPANKPKNVGVNVAWLEHLKTLAPTVEENKSNE